MNRLCSIACSVVFSLTMAACGDSPDPAAQIDTEANPSAPTEGTSGATEPRAEQAQADAATNLPDTASPLPLFGLLGAVSLGAAVSLRYLRHR